MNYALGKILNYDCASNFSSTSVKVSTKAILVGLTYSQWLCFESFIKVCPLVYWIFYGQIDNIYKSSANLLYSWIYKWCVCSTSSSSLFWHLYTSSWTTSVIWNVLCNRFFWEVSSIFHFQFWSRYVTQMGFVNENI